MVLIKNCSRMVYLFLIFNILSCWSSNLDKNVTQSIMLELSIELPDTITLSKEQTPIHIIIRNRTNKDYQVSSLKYWANITFVLRKEGIIVQGIKVKPNMSKREDYILVKSKSSILEKFEYNLEYMYSQLETGNYQITAIFNGNIIDENNKKVSYLSIISEKEFIIN